MINNVIVDSHELPQLSGSEQFTCTTCAFPGHKVHLCKASHPRYQVPAWFSHENNNYVPRQHSRNGSRGESETHWHAKYLLQSMAGRYYFDIVQCRHCRNVTRVISDNCSVSVEHRVSQYSCDAVLHNATVQDCHVDFNGLKIKTTSKDVVMEVYHTHATEEEKIEHLRTRGYKFAEFQAQHIIDQLQSDFEELTKLEVLNPETICDTCVMYREHELHRMMYYEQRYEHEVYGFEVERQYQKKLAALRDLRFMHKNHDYNDMIKYERSYEEDCHTIELVKFEERRIQSRKRKLRQAFDIAHEQAEQNQAPRKRCKYIPGEMFKCGECGFWERKDDKQHTIFYQDDDVISRLWFTSKLCYHGDSVHYKMSEQGYIVKTQQRAVFLCNRCTIPCHNCKSIMPLSNALKYGFCFYCNNNK